MTRTSSLLAQFGTELKKVKVEGFNIAVSKITKNCKPKHILQIFHWGQSSDKGCQLWLKGAILGHLTHYFLNQTSLINGNSNTLWEIRLSSTTCRLLWILILQLKGNATPSISKMMTWIKLFRIFDNEFHKKYCNAESPTNFRRGLQRPQAMPKLVKLGGGTSGH